MPKPESLFRLLWRRARLPAVSALGAAGIALGQTTLVGSSPFAPAGSAGSAGAGAPPEAYELAGSSVEGTRVSVCTFERQSKRSEWIPVGGVSGGVHVLSYDVLNDKAVVTIDGARKELTLRKAAIAAIGASASPMAVASASEPPAPVAPPSAAPAGPSTPASLAAEQREARMLVSDLLEIGVQQRKAYQEAKQKAATAAPAQPSN